MRIVGGELSGRIIRIPRSRAFRPSTERTREAIFSALGGDIAGAVVADLFCGSGALGIEALSRGASSALFVDSSNMAVKAVRENIAKLGLRSCALIHKIDVFRMNPGILNGISIIFADPPYGMGYGERLMSLLCLKKPVVDGILVLEHEKGRDFAESVFEVMRRLKLGDTAVTFFRIAAAS